MKKILVLVVAFVMFIGCNNGNLDTPENGKPTGKQPGRFSATVLSDAMGSGARSARSSVSLGTYTITNSRSIYFILRNVGDFPITDVTLTAGTFNNEVFEPITGYGVTANPSIIHVIETSGNATIENIIEVVINHGNIVGLIAQEYVQKADFAGATIRINGKTTDADDDVIDISLDVDIGTLIKVVSFEVHYSTDNGVTFEKAEWGYQKHFLTLEELEDPLFSGFLIPNIRQELVYNMSEAYVKIKNTGNVPFKYRRIGGNIDEWVWVSIDAGTFSERLPPYSSQIYFNIDTQGLVFDNSGIDALVFYPNTSIINFNFRTIYYDLIPIHWEVRYN
ncbi:MAG: hypothetical protein LBC80_07835 [Treponema sp.]|jgi:hypothetical protein|nr:hypothetical protein [Treponema sp.]